MIEITDIYDNRINYYKSLKFTPKSHTEANIFISEGRKVVEKLLKSNLEIVSFFATKEFYDKFALLIENHNIPADQQFLATKDLLKNIVGFKLHTGVMALAKVPKFATTNELSNLTVALSNITDAENVGSIVRNMAAFSCKSLIFDASSTSPYLRRAVRVSMGNVFDIKVCYAESLANSLQLLKDTGHIIIAAEVTENSKSIDEYEFPQKCVIVFGNEVGGVAKEILEICDFVLRIPINSSVNSINVAAASAIFLREIQKYSIKNNANR